jgi:hypothetical protein
LNEEKESISKDTSNRYSYQQKPKRKIICQEMNNYKSVTIAVSAFAQQTIDRDHIEIILREHQDVSLPLNVLLFTQLISCVPFFKSVVLVEVK